MCLKLAHVHIGHDLQFVALELHCLLLQQASTTGSTAASTNTHLDRAWVHRMLQSRLLGRCMYIPLRHLRHLGKLHCAPTSSCAFYVRATKAEKLEGPVPGTVKQYEQHVMIQAAPLRSDRAAQQCHSAHGIWWPSAVER